MEHKFDLHVHSIHSSDGASSVEDIIEAARKAGLSGIAVTDHNEVAGTARAVKLCNEIGGFIAIPGIEVSSADGHILGLGITEKVQRDLAPSETVKAIRGLGGIAVAAHPYRFWSGLGEEITLENDFDCIEIMNARSPDPDNAKAAVIAEKMRLPGSGGSDSHELDTIGKGFTVVDIEELDAGNVIEAIMDGKARVGGTGRGISRALKYATRSVGKWSKRGFKRI